MNKLILANSMTVEEKMHWLLEQISILQDEVTNLKRGDENCWVQLAVAADILGKSSSAVRQRLRHPRKPMPEGKVWKQEAKGCEIFINLKNYRKYM